MGEHRFTWDNWEQARYKLHLRKSYYMLLMLVEKPYHQLY